MFLQVRISKALLESRDLGEMYQNYIDQFEDEEDLTDFQKSQKEKAEAELRAYLTTGSKIKRI